MKYFLKGLFLLFLIFLPNLLIYLVNGLCYFVFNLVHFVWHFKLYELNYKKCTNKIYLIFEKWYEDGDDFESYY